RLKALIQATAAKLPDRWSVPVYFPLLRTFGELRPQRIDPMPRLSVGMDLCRRIAVLGRSPVGAPCFQVGTRRRLNLPLACWLCGATRVVTVLLNPYRRIALVQEGLAFLRGHAHALLPKLQSKYGDLLDRDRWQRLLAIGPRTADDFRDACGIEYMAPAD